MKQVPDAGEWLTVNADTHHEVARALLSPPARVSLGLAAAAAIAAGRAGHCFMSAPAQQHQPCNPRTLGSGQCSGKGSRGVTSSWRDPPSMLYPPRPRGASCCSGVI